MMLAWLDAVTVSLPPLPCASLPEPETQVPDDLKVKLA